MKLLNITSIIGLMLISTQLFSGVIENSQILPPPGPYQSILNYLPPEFVPYGSKQAQVNPNSQSYRPQIYNHFPADTRSMIRPPVQTPAWVINQQQTTRESVEKMLKENAVRNKEDEKRYAEYLKKSEEMADEREKKNKQWMEENNKQMKQAWQNMLNQYSKNQKQQIQQAENMPKWMKERMLKQHEQQLTMMNANSPMEMNVMQRSMRHPMNHPPQMQQHPGQPPFNTSQAMPQPRMRTMQQPMPQARLPFNSGQPFNETPVYSTPYNRYPR